MTHNKARGELNEEHDENCHASWSWYHSWWWHLFNEESRNEEKNW